MGVCLYDQVEFPWATNYLDRIPNEPLGVLGWMTVDTSQAIEPTLEDLCYYILDRKGWTRYGQAIMFVTHGTPRALNLKLFSREGKPLFADDFDALIRLADSAGADADLQKACAHFKESKDMMYMIYDYVNQVRQLCPAVLAIRACRIGNNREYLTKLARLLNVRTISAPLQRDFFGVDRNPVVGTPAGLTYDQAVEKVKKVAKPMGEAPNRVLMTFRPLADHKFQATTLAESTQGMVNFLNGAFRFKKRATSWTPQEGVVIYGVMKAGKYYVFPGMPGYQELFLNFANPHFRVYPPTEMPALPPIPGTATVTRPEFRRMRRAAFFEKVRAVVLH